MALPQNGLDVDVFDAAFFFAILLMLASLARELREEQRTAVTLGLIALRMLEPIRRLHAQTDGAARGAIGVVKDSGMAMLVESNGRDATTEGTGLIRIPGIEGGTGTLSGDGKTGTKALVPPQSTDAVSI